MSAESEHFGVRTPAELRGRTLTARHGPDAMKTVTPEAFARFLAWLGQDANDAGARYRDIHKRLVKIFACWGGAVPEELADRTLDRVVLKLDQIRDSYTGDPFAYVLGVARNVRREDYRASSRARAQLLATDALERAGGAEDAAAERAREDRKLGCLNRCLGEALSPEEGRLLLDYYRDSRRALGARRNLAANAGLSSAALRKRTQRCRQRLAACLQECLASEVVTGTSAAT